MTCPAREINLTFTGCRTCPPMTEGPCKTANGTCADFYLGTLRCATEHTMCDAEEISLPQNYELMYNGMIATDPARTFYQFSFDASKIIINHTLREPVDCLNECTQLSSCVALVMSNSRSCTLLSSVDDRSPSTSANLMYSLRKLTASPTHTPSYGPTQLPSIAPSVVPTLESTISPTSKSPTQISTRTPSAIPTAIPTLGPTPLPTSGPPTHISTLSPSQIPTSIPVAIPTSAPLSRTPTHVPTVASAIPTVMLTREPTSGPTASPTTLPSEHSLTSTVAATSVTMWDSPTAFPTVESSVAPSFIPSYVPTQTTPTVVTAAPATISTIQTTITQAPTQIIVSSHDSTQFMSAAPSKQPSSAQTRPNQRITTTSHYRSVPSILTQATSRASDTTHTATTIYEDAVVIENEAPQFEANSSTDSSTGFPWWIIVVIVAIGGIFVIIVVVVAIRRQTKYKNATRRSPQSIPLTPPNVYTIHSGRVWASSPTYVEIGNSPTQMSLSPIKYSGTPMSIFDESTPSTAALSSRNRREQNPTYCPFDEDGMPAPESGSQEFCEEPTTYVGIDPTERSRASPEYALDVLNYGGDESTSKIYPLRSKMPSVSSINIF